MLMDLYAAGNIDEITQELCDTVVLKTPSITLGWIPKQFRTRNICMNCLKYKPSCYNLVPEEIMDREMWAEVFKRDGKLINNGDIPAEILDQEMYEAAVLHGKLHVKYVPQRFRNKAICESMLTGYERGFKLMPLENITEKMWTEIFTEEPGYMGYGYIPEEMLNQEMYEKAVINGGMHLKYVPQAFRSKTICRFILGLKKLTRDDGFKYFPSDIVNDKSLHHEFVSINGNFLSQIRDEDKTVDVCRAAIKQTREALLYLPLNTESLMPLIVELIENDAEIYNLLPDRCKTTTIHMKMLIKHGITKDGLSRSRNPKIRKIALQNIPTVMNDLCTDRVNPCGSDTTESMSD